MKMIYSAPEVEKYTVQIEKEFLGLSGGEGNATGENMSVSNDEEW